MADTTRNEPPRLHITHHQASRIEHTGVGEYQVTMSLRVEMVNAQKEMVTFQRIPTKQKRRSTGPGAKKPFDPQRPEKTRVPAGASGHELSRPKRVPWRPAYGMMSAMSIPVSCVGVKTHVFMNDLVVAQETLAVECSSRLDFLLLHTLGTSLVAP
jgi:hypothetical protein